MQMVDNVRSWMDSYIDEWIRNFKESMKPEEKKSGDVSIE
jgi:hypothetical protein